jgi:N-acetylglucosamine-6-phosphate deacetylase
MACLIRDSVRYLEIPMDESLRMANVHVAGAFGARSDELMIRAETPANLVGFTNQLEITFIMEQGRISGRVG